jgi:hypothetical protein
VALLPYGTILALLGIPFGGSLLTLLVACLLYIHSVRADKIHAAQRLRAMGPLPATGPKPSHEPLLAPADAET